MKRLFARLFNTLPKRVATLAVLGMAVAVPASSIATTAVAIEGSMGVANVTRGDTQYKDQVDASYDQVVKVQVYYHNREDENSGKVAENLRVKVDMPTAPGTTQVVRGTISGTNTNTVQDSVTVKLDRADATLEYIPGSAVWRHNTGTNAAPIWTEQVVSDSIVTSGTGIVLENEKPCFNFAATVTVLARVRVPGIQITKQVRVKGTTAWTTTNTAKPGDSLEYQITYKNMGNTTHKSVVIRDNLPPKMQYVPGTTMLANDSGVKSVADGVTTGGIIVGNYGPGAAAYVKFEVKVPNADQLACGVTEFRNVGVARPEGMNEFYNTAITNVTKVCENVPTYSCDLLEVTKGDNRTVTISQFKESHANGATFKDAVIDWGDGSTQLTTNAPVGKTHQYSKDGEYTISATARFTVNGQTKEATSAACVKKVNFTTPTTPPTTPPVTPPTTLPNTGAGDIIGIFVATTVAGAIAHKFVWASRFGA